VAGQHVEQERRQPTEAVRGPKELKALPLEADLVCVRVVSLGPELSFDGCEDAFIVLGKGKDLDVVVIPLRSRSTQSQQAA
jgi:hypothetical protein